MYLEFTKKKTKNGVRTYVAAKSSHRVKNKIKKFIHKNYGVLEELEKENPNALEDIKKDFAVLQNQDGTNILNVNLSIKTIEEKRSLTKNVGYKFIEKIYDSFALEKFFRNETKNLKIEYDINKIFKYLVISKMFKLGSKKNAFNHKKDFFDGEKFNFSEHDMYRSLTVLNSLKEAMQLHLHEKLSVMKSRDISVVFYDVTNYWFEINDVDKYDEKSDKKSIRRAIGVSKENRKNPIIQMGLFIDNDGIPIGYKLFDGNTNDQSTLRPALNAIKKTFELNKIIIVADKGLNSKKNLGFLLKNEHGFIVSRKVRGSAKEFRDWILEQKDYQIINRDFKIKSTIVDKEYVDERNEKISSKTKIIVFHSRKYQVKENHERYEYLKSISQLIGQKNIKQATDNKGTKKYLNYDLFDDETGEIQKTKVNISLNKKKLENDLELDGYYVIETSETQYSNDLIIEKYRSLWRIEDSFKVIKSDLEGRPVFVNRPEHIEAHFLICFVALFITRIMQNKLGYQDTIHKPFNYSASAIIEALKSFTVKEVISDVYSVNDYNPLMKLIANQAKIDIDFINMTYKMIKEI